MLFCHRAGSEGFWLRVASGHLACDAGSSQELSGREQEAAAEPKRVKKHYWAKIPNFLNAYHWGINGKLAEKNSFRAIKEEIK